jgi:MYXO-CTERM domain-containing protein
VDLDGPLAARAPDPGAPLDEEGDSDPGMDEPAGCAAGGRGASPGAVLLLVLVLAARGRRIGGQVVQVSVRNVASRMSGRAW